MPKEEVSGDESPKRSITRFNFHRHSKKKKDKRDKRERKATTTLAIVLGKSVKGKH